MARGLLDVLLVVLAAAIMVQASDDLATAEAPTGLPTVPPTPPPTQSQAAKMEAIHCEVAVAKATSGGLALQEKILKYKGKEMAQAALDEGQAAYNKVERAASRDEMMSFGLRYAALKQENKALNQVAANDDANKIKYVNAVAKLPNLDKEIEATKSEHTVLVAKIASMEKAIRMSKIELADELSKQKDMKKALPLKKSMIDTQYTKPLMGMRSANAGLQVELNSEGKHQLKADVQVMPLATGLKAEVEKVELLRKEYGKKKIERKEVQVQTIALSKSNSKTTAGLSYTLADGKDNLESVVKNGADGDEEASDSAEQDSLEGKKLKAEQDGEAEVEEEEKADDHETLAMQLGRKERVKLTAQLKVITDRVNAEEAANAEHAAKELAIVKDSYAEKLEIQKAAHKQVQKEAADKADAAAAAAAADDGDSDSKEAELMEAKLNAAVPTLDP